MTSRLSVVIVIALAACGACGQRGGMGRVEFETCAGSPTGAERFTVCTEDAAFLDEASRLLAAGETRTPDVGLVEGRSCDSRWTWHADPDTPVFSDGGPAGCDGCPSFIEAHKAYWVGTVTRFCPWTAKIVAVAR